MQKCLFHAGLRSLEADGKLYRRLAERVLEYEFAAGAPVATARILADCRDTLLDIA